LILVSFLLLGCAQAPELQQTPQTLQTPPELQSTAAQATASVTAEPQASNSLDVVQTDAGLVKGKTEEGVRAYLGIPYAAAPTGELRWKPPQPIARWNGVLDVEEFASPCTQSLADVRIQHETKNSTSEDCLYLNVWTPAKNAGEKLAVMAWIHGGAFAVGSGSMKEYYGKELAKKGVVVVSLNYRLGPLGFLAHPELAAESSNNASGNYGLLDQIAALQWVKKNVAAFGGDPERVTVFGESAGSMSVSSHIASPLSKGLFEKGISESGTIFSLEYALADGDGSLESAFKTARDYAERLGCSGENQLACLRNKTAEEIQNATRSEALFGPVFDGWFFPEDPHAIFSQGKQNNVPLLIGFNADEGSLFTNTSEASKEYRENAFVVPELLVADSMKTPVYFYEFTRAPPTALGKRFGVYHSSEIPYVFGTLDAADGYTEEDFALSEKMMGYWTNFAETGDPNGVGLPEWPVYQAQAREYLELGVNVTVKSGLS